MLRLLPAETDFDCLTRRVEPQAIPEERVLSACAPLAIVGKRERVVNDNRRAKAETQAIVRVPSAPERPAIPIAQSLFRFVPLPRRETARRLAARAGRSDAAMFAFFFVWNLAWFGRYLDLPFYWDAAGYVSHHAYNIYLHPWLPFVTGDYDTGHPTLFFWIVALVWRLVGVSAAAGRVVEFAFGALLLLYVFKTGRRLGLGAWAFWTALMAGLVPIVASQTAHFQIDIPHTALFSAASYYLFRKGRNVAFVAFASALVLTKLTGFILLAPMMAYALCESARTEGVNAWRAHFRRLRVFAIPLSLLAAFFAIRYLATGTVVAKFHVSQTAMSADLRALLSNARHYICAVTLLNDVYVQAPLILVAAALFWRPGRRENADFSWRAYLAYGLLAFAAYSPPHIMRSAYGPLPRHFMIYLVFVCLASGWSLRCFWRWRPFAAAVSYALLCGVFLAHWHPKYADRIPNRILRSILVNQWVRECDRSCETNLVWTDHAKCLKEFGRYLRKKHPENPPPISARFPEGEVIMYPFNGCVRGKIALHAHRSADDLARWLSEPGAKYFLRGSNTIAEYSLDDVLRRVPLRKVKEWRRHRASYALFERAGDPLGASPE